MKVMVNYASITTGSLSCPVTLFISLGAALPAQHIEQQESSTYDFIVVGGGTAGLALAARLSEIDAISVLVLEAGTRPDQVTSYQAPGANQQVLGSTIDWSYGTLPQPGLNDRQLVITKDDALVSTTFHAPTATNISAQGYNASLYSDGPVQVTYPPYVYTHPGSEAFVESLSAIGLPSVQELNGGNNIGTKQETLTMDSNFRRSSSFDSYYIQARNRPNLHVHDTSPVQQVVLEETSNGVIATGVVYVDNTSGKTLNATAKKEVIMSTGAITTPQILMLSGIGPTEVLRKAGVQQYVINENVGKNLQDHVYFSVVAEARPSISYSSLYHDYSKLQQAEKEYESSSGPLTAPIGLSFGFEKISAEQLDAIGAARVIAQNRTEQAHIEYLYETNYYPNAPSPFYSPKEYNTSYVSFTAAIVAPTSRGNVSILSSSISDPPQLNPMYLTASEDQALALYSFHNLRKVPAKFAESNYTIGPDNGEVAPGPEIQSDEDILNYIRETSTMVWHASGTCSMLPLDSGGVVDSTLKVYGVQGLRVVDASVFPVIPDTHTQGPTYMLAEKAAELIKAEYELYSSTN